MFLGKRWFRYQEGGIPPAYDGIDTDTAIDQLADTKAPFLRNFLVDRPGQLPMRGPINEAFGVFGSSGPKPVLAWTFNNVILIGMKAASATATRDPWVAPYRRPATAAELSDFSTPAYHFNLESGVLTSIAVTAANSPGHSYSRLGANVWGIAFDSATSDTYQTGMQNRRALLKWDGTAVAPTTYADSTKSPLGSQAIRTHNQRIWVLGGMKPGTTTYKPNSLFYSILDGPGAEALANWQDPITGLVNEIVVDSDDAADFGVAIAKVNQNLLVLKRRSIHLVVGYSASTYLVKTLTTDMGCLDPRSVLEYNGGVCFMSDQGLMFYDGARFTNLSSSLRSTLLINALQVVGDSGVDGGRVHVGRLSNEYLAVSVGKSPASAATSTTSFCAMYHMPRHAWVYLSSGLFVDNAPTHVGRGMSKNFMLDDSRVALANKIAAPELAAPGTQGVDVGDTLFTFDASGTGPKFNGTGNTLKNQLTAVEAWTGTLTFPIESKWVSKLFRLNEPTYRSKLARFLIDYNFQTATGADDVSNGWYIKLINGLNTTLLPEYQVPTQGTSSTYVYRRQNTQDVFSETADFQIQVEWRGSSTYLTKANLLSSQVEYEATSQRRST